MEPKEGKKMNAAAEAKHIPHEIVLDILLRLPAKSLLRFKAVRKSWQSLISSHQFVKSHLVLANKGQTGNLQSYGVISLHENGSSFSRRRSKSARFACINSGDTNRKEEIKLDYLFGEGPIYNINILGSCNGLLLIATSYDYFLWNPSTGEYKELPSCNLPDDSTHISGLGYHSSGHHDEYKAVIVAHVTSPPGSPHGRDDIYEGFHVYLLKSGFSDWKQIMVEDYGFFFRIYSSWSFGLTLDGAPHWVVRPQEEKYHSAVRMIIYFDVAEEKFKKLPQPEFVENTKFDLAMLLGYLCIVHNQEASEHVDIWAMKEYGVKESWSRLFVIKLSVRNLMPLGFTKNGDEVVMEIDWKILVIYNLKTKKQKFIMATESKFGFKVAAYVESLVSPNVMQFK